MIRRHPGPGLPQENRIEQQHNGSSILDAVFSLPLPEAMAGKDQAYDALRQHIPGFKSRQGQEQLMNGVTESIASGELLACQAGTGVGKTFGYLLGAAPFLMAKRHKVIISTHTIALQTQLMEKDLPLFQQAVIPSLRFAIAKGSERYFCPQRAASLLRTDSEAKSQQPLELDEQELVSQNALLDHKLLADIQTVQTQFHSGEFDGDLDTLTLDNPERLTPFIGRKANRCHGKKSCKAGNHCPYYQQRELIETADIVVANHALTATVLNHQTSLLGELGERVLILDEAHHFPDVYRNAMVNRFVVSEELEQTDKVHKVCKLFDQLYKLAPSLTVMPDYQQLKSSLAGIDKRANNHAEQMASMQQLLQLNFATLRGEPENGFDNPAMWVLRPDVGNAKPFTDALAQLCLVAELFQQSIVDFNARILAPLKQCADQESEKIAYKARDLILLLNELEDERNNVVAALQRFVQFEELFTTDERLAAGLARWIEFQPEEQTFTISSNALWIGQQFQETVVNAFHSIIMVSATLEGLDGFAFFSKRLALDLSQGQRLLKVQSPFDYSRVGLKAPFREGNPNDPEHALRVARYLESCHQRHKAILVLFSSYRQLEQTYQALAPRLRELVLCQHHYSKHELLKQHVARIDDGNSSILFGVDGLAEGVDLKGHYLTCVVISKLPFPHLYEPMLRYEVKTLDAQQRSSFTEISLPLCSRKLIQAAGRLIRSEEDFGEVVLLDSRVYHKKYAAQLLACLPMYPGAGKTRAML